MDKNVNNNDKAFAVGVSINKLGYPKPYLYGVPFGFFFFWGSICKESSQVACQDTCPAKVLVLGGGGGGVVACPAGFSSFYDSFSFFYPK